MTVKDTLNKLKNLERETRKNLIMDAAESVFATRPYDKVSMREIATEAGIAVSSIYTYFSNQEELFADTTIRGTEILLDKLNEIIKNDQSKNAIATIIDNFIEYISQHDSYFRMMVLFMTHGNLSENSLEKLNSIMRQALDLFDSGFSRLNIATDTRMLSRYFFASLNGILVTYRKLPGRSEEEVVEHMKNLGKILLKMIISLEKNEG